MRTHDIYPWKVIRPKCLGMAERTATLSGGTSTGSKTSIHPWCKLYMDDSDRNLLVPDLPNMSAPGIFGPTGYTVQRAD